MIGWRIFVLEIQPTYSPIRAALLHAILYLYFVFFISWKSNKKLFLVTRFGIPVYYIFLIAIGFILDVLVKSSHESLFFIRLVLSLFFSISFCHYLFDAFIWKLSSSRNRDIIGCFGWGEEIRTEYKFY